MRIPLSAISASAPHRSSARIVPPWPSGDSATRLRSASRIRPLWRSTAGISPWTNRRSRSTPNESCWSKNAVVSAWFCGLVMT